MTLNESDTRSKLIDPILYDCSWTGDLIRHEETAEVVVITDNRTTVVRAG